TDDAAKIAIPVTRTVRWPKRSPSAPAVNIRVAKTSVYEPTAHWSWPGEAPSPRTGLESVSKAMVRMVLSIQMTIGEKTSTARINRCRGIKTSRVRLSGTCRSIANSSGTCQSFTRGRVGAVGHFLNPEGTLTFWVRSAWLGMRAAIGNDLKQLGL